MKKVITMVGTSIFENYIKDRADINFERYYKDLIEKRESSWDVERERIERLRNYILSWDKVRNISEIQDISAEIKSLIKLKEELSDDLEVYLLCSDTVLSRLAGDIVKKILEDNRLGSIFEPCVIRKLQIWDRKEFNEGMSNLISKIYEIAYGYWENIVINITGGYKATIPYLTILAQVNKCPLYYIFEKTDSLIKIPNIPFSKEWFDWDKLLNYENWLNKLEKGITEIDEYHKLINSDFYNDYSFLVWIERPFAELNPIGKIILNKLRTILFVFYATDEVISMIQTSSNIKSLFINQFSNKNLRESKTEIKNGHYVYDAGDNQLRIFYRDKNGKLYVYKVFSSHDDYERYLRENFNTDILSKYNFVPYKLKKED